MAIVLKDSLTAWGSDHFAETLKQELRQLDAKLLPLHQAMAQGSHVSDTMIEPVVLHREVGDGLLKVKVGIFYSSVIAGSCCADDPSPICEENEYCEVMLLIRQDSGDTVVELL